MTSARTNFTKVLFAVGAICMASSAFAVDGTYNAYKYMCVLDSGGAVSCHYADCNRKTGKCSYGAQGGSVSEEPIARKISPALKKKLSSKPAVSN